MIQQALSEVRMRTLLDGLPATLGVLANDDVCRRDYARYVSDMYPSNHRGNAPGLDMAVDFIRRLWNDICANRTGSTPGTLLDRYMCGSGCGGKTAASNAVRPRPWPAGPRRRAPRGPVETGELRRAVIAPDRHIAHLADQNAGLLR